MFGKYTKEFKQEALKLCERPGTTVARVARDLGIPVGLLYRWQQEIREDGEGAVRGLLATVALMAVVAGLILRQGQMPSGDLRERTNVDVEPTPSPGATVYSYPASIDSPIEEGYFAAEMVMEV